VFDVGSLGQVVAAYASLCLVKEGRFELDRPLGENLKTPFLPAAAKPDSITLRHLLTHTSGLSNRIDADDRRLIFPPGERFAYAAMGFSYLTAVISEVAGGEFQSALASLVFRPLAMDSSSYVSEESFRDRLASAHVETWIPMAVFTVLFSAAALVAWVVGFALERWIPFLRVSRGRRLVLLVTAFVTAIAIGSVWPGLSVSLLCAALFLGPVVVIALVWRITRRRPSFRLGALLVVLVLGGYFAGRPVGLPPVDRPEPNAAYSLRSTAKDMGEFLLEWMHPAHLGAELADAMRTPQVEVKPGFSWGLGIGIAHTDRGDALWHWSQDLGFESLLLAYPHSGLGVVVLTNGTGGLSVAAEVAQRAIGGPSPQGWWRLPKAY
jgi:CubicO group peptidase (beta-lactamase class C family)